MKQASQRFFEKGRTGRSFRLSSSGLLATEEKEVISFSSSPGGETDKFIIPKNNGLK
jgi:hypothetical protein